MNKLVLLFLFLPASARIARAQLVTFGVTGGVPLIERTTGGGDESRPYIVGPSFEFRLPAGFAVEVDALYQRIGFNRTFQPLSIAGEVGTGLTFGSGLTFFNDRQRGNSWQFPLIGKYYFRSRTSSWQPFVGTGYAFRAVGVHQSINETTVDSSGVSHPLSFKEDSRADAAVGAVFSTGLRYRVNHFTLAPEVRYTRWGSSNNFSLNKNEAAFLLGIHF